MKALRVVAVAVLPFGLVAYGFFRAGSALWRFVFRGQDDTVSESTRRHVYETAKRAAYLADMEVRGGGRAAQKTERHGAIGPNTFRSRYTETVH